MLAAGLLQEDGPPHLNTCSIILNDISYGLTRCDMTLNCYWLDYWWDHVASQAYSTNIIASMQHQLGTCDT